MPRPKTIVDLIFTTGRASKSSLNPNASPYLACLSAILSGGDYQFKRQNGMGESSFVKHIQVFGSTENFIRSFMEAGPNTKMMDTPFLDLVKQHCDLVKNLPKEELENRTFTHETGEKGIGHLESNITIVDIPSAEDLATNPETMKRFFEMFPGLVYYLTPELSKEFFDQPVNKRETWMVDNHERLDLSTKEIMKDGKPLSGRYMALGKAFVGNGPHNIFVDPVYGLKGQFVCPFTTNYHPLSGVAGWGVFFHPDMPGKLIVFSLHIGKNKAWGVDKVNDHAAPRLKTLITEMLVERTKFGWEKTHEDFMEHLYGKNPGLYKRWLVMSEAQRFANPPLIGFQRRMGFTTDFEFKRLYLPLNDLAAVEKFKKSTYDVLVAEAEPSGSRSGMTVDGYPIEAAGLLVAVDLDSPEYDPDSKLSEEQRKELREFVRDSLKTGINKSLTSLGENFTKILREESKASKQEGEAIKQLPEVTSAVDKYIAEVYTKKFMQMQADAPDSVKDVAVDTLRRWIDSIVRENYVEPIFKSEGVFDDLYDVEREKLEFEELSKEFDKVKLDTVDLEKQVTDTKQQMEAEKLKMGKDFEHMTKEQAAKWSNDLKELEKKEVKLKESKDKEKKAETDTLEKAKEVKKVEKAKSNIEKHVGLH